MGRPNYDRDGKYIGPDRRKLDRRKMILQEDDINIIAKIVEEKHVCRYDIEPGDMKALLDFVKVFRDGAIETKSAIRTFIIKKVIPRAVVVGVLTALADYLGFLRPLLRAMLNTLKGS